jgi:hypothetical protein
LVNRHGSDKLAVVRAARSGDVIVMLAMDTNEIPPHLALHLQSLQKLVAGFPPDMIHVTLQRYGSKTISSGYQLFDRLKKMKAALDSFDVVADGYLPVFSDFLDKYLLKWTIPGSLPLRCWYRLVDEIGSEVGLQPLYLRQGYGAWVTALLEIDPARIDQLDHCSIPNPLFRVCRLVVSRLLDRGNYELLGEFLF